MQLHEVTDKVIQSLEVGTEVPIADNFCKYCKSTDLVLVIKLKATQGSLAGAQPKVSARKTAYLRCNGCNHQSEGK